MESMGTPKQEEEIHSGRVWFIQGRCFELGTLQGSGRDIVRKVAAVALVGLRLEAERVHIRPRTKLSRLSLFSNYWRVARLYMYVFKLLSAERLGVPHHWSIQPQVNGEASHPRSQLAAPLLLNTPVLLVPLRRLISTQQSLCNLRILSLPTVKPLLYIKCLHRLRARMVSFSEL